jgi:hypothetical protein
MGIWHPRQSKFRKRRFDDETLKLGIESEIIDDNITNIVAAIHQGPGRLIFISISSNLIFYKKKRDQKLENESFDMTPGTYSGAECNEHL